LRWLLNDVTENQLSGRSTFGLFLLLRKSFLVLPSDRYGSWRMAERLDPGAAYVRPGIAITVAVADA
jgi:hypothetical protein